MCIKDTWTEPKGSRIEGGGWRWLGLGSVRAGKWRQLYLSNNKKRKKTTKEQTKENENRLIKTDQTDGCPHGVGWEDG